MFHWFFSQNIIIKAILATMFTFSVTTLGSSIVFFFKKINKNILDSMLGLSAGIMIAATFWSLLNPAINLVNNNKVGIYIICIGFISGGLFLKLGDNIYDYTVKNNNNLKRIFMLILSITLHNIPEGLAIGVAFGSLNYNLSGATLSSALLLALGIGIQNFPEGSAVSLPLRREGYSRFKSFLYGSLTGIVEPLGGIIGVLLITSIRKLLPLCLSFAGGAMIFVVVKELIPESQTNSNNNMITLWTMIGFMIMMFLDVTLG